VLESGKLMWRQSVNRVLRKLIWFDRPRI
jgi:hypothetical protein